MSSIKRNVIADYQNLPKFSVIPDPKALIETFRAIGYRLETAIADILDNSIAAEARRIDLQFDGTEPKPTIYILDDGIGMSDDGIKQAMKAGSKNPLEIRSPKDLGRFGLGLKTASFSQCRKLTVISKQKDGDIHYWTWDLDYVGLVGEWEIISERPAEKYLKRFQDRPSGTMVLWEVIDRIKNMRYDGKKKQNAFEIAKKDVSSHLEMIFHRYIKNPKYKLGIFIDGKKLKDWDPFLLSDKQVSYEEKEISLTDGSKVQGYVLPHTAKLSKHEVLSGEGAYGWTAQQGFYVYRNDRLLVAGNWLGLFRRGDGYKLARLRIDITSERDEAWQIDIRKSSAILPAGLRSQLTGYAKNIREQALKTYRDSDNESGSKTWTPETEQGFYGELYFLQTLLHHLGQTADQTHLIELILKSWVGMKGESQDFHYQTWSVEVKAGTSKSNRSVHISSAEQLERARVQFLGICYYELAQDNFHGQTSGQLAAEIIRYLEQPQYINIFQRKLPTNIDSANRLYTIQQKYHYHIGADFPRLTANNLPPAVTEVKYKLDLTRCQDSEMDEVAFLNALVF